MATHKPIAMSMTTWLLNSKTSSKRYMLNHAIKICIRNLLHVFKTVVFPINFVALSDWEELAELPCQTQAPEPLHDD